MCACVCVCVCVCVCSVSVVGVYVCIPLSLCVCLPMYAASLTDVHMVLEREENPQTYTQEGRNHLVFFTVSNPTTDQMAS